MRRTLGMARAGRGHRIVFGERDLSGERVNELRQASGNLPVACNAEAVKDAQVIALCTPLVDSFDIGAKSLTPYRLCAAA